MNVPIHFKSTNRTVFINTRAPLDHIQRILSKPELRELANLAVAAATNPLNTRFHTPPMTARVFHNTKGYRDLNASFARRHLGA